MRVIHGVIVLGVLSAGCGERVSDGASPGPVETTTPAPGGSGSPGPVPCGDQVVTVAFGLNADHPSGKETCELLDVKPDNVPVCVDTKKITWEYVNACTGQDVKVQIGAKRRQKYGNYKTKERDPLVGGGDFEDLKTVGAQKIMVSAMVKEDLDDAPDGLYKYDLEGEIKQAKWKVDPEIDVRRTTRRIE